MISNNNSLLFFSALCYCFSFSTLAAPAQTDSFLQKLLRISGISATPQRMRGEEKGEPGQIWLVNIEKLNPVHVGSGNDFHSPVFLPNDTGLLVLRQDQVIEVSLADAVQKPLFQIPGIIKIIGFDQSDDNHVLILLNDNQLELVSMDTGSREKITYPAGDEAELFLSHIKSWDRVYGDTRVYVKTRRKRMILGQRSFSNVYYQYNQQPIDLSQCKKRSCSQPSLSYDGNSVVFIKSN